MGNQTIGNEERRVSPRLIAITAVLILIAILLWLQNGRNIANAAHKAYLTANCQTALPLYEQLTSYPNFVSFLLADTIAETAQCQALETARQTESQGPSTAIAAYEQFITNHETSPLTTPALAAIHRLYLDWATAELQTQNFAQAITILEKATTDYPALEAETEERLLQGYLAWGETLQSAGDFQAALIVYNDLQSQYPQFTAEAQAGIDKVNSSMGQ